jgi:hypothetical protein
MKRLLVILLFPVIVFSQSDTCFTTQEVLDISFTLDSLTELTDINQQIIQEQSYLIADLKHYIALDSIEINFYKRQVDALNKNVDLYIEREKLIKPKWYDNKTIWFASGIVSTILTAKLIVEVVK